uniref:Putative SGNH hydrolase-type esterase domain-containing protein n=1 Tax=Helianthus annuus TaxID=4232 RepID=A0A251V1D1_HELAN
MGISSYFFPMIPFLMLILITGTLHANGCYTSIISFGDSLADTGNLKQLNSKSNSQPPHCWFRPLSTLSQHTLMNVNMQKR